MPPKFDNTAARVASLAMNVTEAGHVQGVGGGGASSQFISEFRTKNGIRPGGNGVSLEDEMLKVAGNQMDYQAATSLYTRSLGLVKTAIGKR